MLVQGSISILIFIGLILTSTVFAAIQIDPVLAETGIGPDVFKVIMTIFGVDETKSDVIAVVTVKNEEAKVKLFDASGPEVIPLNASEGGGHLIEYVATFPNVTVNSGDEYKACIFIVKDLELICKTGHNSPATRPEFVDLSLNATRSVEDQAAAEDSEEVDDADETNEAEEEINV
jgi:hypothetical protein